MQNLASLQFACLIFIWWNRKSTLKFSTEKSSPVATTPPKYKSSQLVFGCRRIDISKIAIILISININVGDSLKDFHFIVWQLCMRFFVEKRAFGCGSECQSNYVRNSDWFAVWRESFSKPLATERYLEKHKWSTTTLRDAILIWIYPAPTSHSLLFDKIPFNNRNIRFEGATIPHRQAP